MKIAFLLPFVLYASLAVAKVKKPNGSGSSNQEEDQQAAAADSSATSTETQDVGEVISSFYPTQVPSLVPSASTALADNLLAVQSSWYASPEYTSVGSAIARFLPSSLSSSVSASGYKYPEIMTQNWYTKNVPPALQTEVRDYISKIESVHYKFVPTSTGAVTTKVKGSGAMNTGVPLGVVGIVGVVGGVFAAVL